MFGDIASQLFIDLAEYCQRSRLEQFFIDERPAEIFLFLAALFIVAV